MDYAALLEGIAKLGPSVASVLAIAIICYYLIQLINRVLGMFDKFGVNMEAHTRTMEKMGFSMEKMGDNIEANTKATVRMVEILEKR